MTPERAEQISLEARMKKYQEFQDSYKPVNQRLTVLAGYQAIIDEVRKEVDAEWAMKLLGNMAGGSNRE